MAESNRNLHPNLLVKLPSEYRSLYLQKVFRQTYMQLIETYSDKKVVTDILWSLGAIARPYPGQREGQTAPNITDSSFVFINPLEQTQGSTGGLLWKPGKNTHFFGAIEPVVEERNVVIPTPISEWDYVDVTSTLHNAVNGALELNKIGMDKALQEILANPGISEPVWSSMGVTEREVYIQSNLAKIVAAAIANTGQPINAEIIYAQTNKLFYLAGPLTEKVNYQAGVTIKEYDERGSEADSFTLFLEQAPVDAHAPGFLQKTKYQIRVRRKDKSEATYDWAQNEGGKNAPVFIHKAMVE